MNLSHYLINTVDMHNTLDILDSSLEHGAHIWIVRYFNLFKAFGDIERVVKSDFFSSEKPCYTL